jgi:hypothetical protein
MFIENPLNSSELAVGILECVHIVSFALAIGTITIIDFRLLGLGLRRQSPAQLIKDLDLWTILGLTVAIFTGLLLFSTDPDKYYLNVSFLFKIACLVLAIIFHYTIFRKVAVARTSPAGWAVACVSFALWTAVLFGAIFISFVREGLSFG